MSLKTSSFELPPCLLRSTALMGRDRTTDPNRKGSGTLYPFSFSRLFIQCFVLILPMDALDQLCNIYQNGRPLEEYIHEFFPCSRQVSLDRWTLVDCFRSGLDEEIAQRMPLAGSRWTLPNYSNLAWSLSRVRLLAANPESSLLVPSSLSQVHHPFVRHVLRPLVTQALCCSWETQARRQFLGQARQPPLTRARRSLLPQAQSPLQSPNRSRSSQSPLQSPLWSRSSQSPLQSLLRSRSSQSPLQSTPKCHALPERRIEYELPERPP